MRIDPTNITSLAKSAASKLPALLDVNAASVPTRDIPKIDMSKDIIVIWVPGTSSHKVHPRFEYYASLQWGDRADIVLADYTATWAFSKSLPDGFRTLKNMVDYVLKNKRPGQKLVLGGESQGAIIIGELMARPEYYNGVDKAVLLGHPGISDIHYSGDKKVLEINNPADPTTFLWPGEMVDTLKQVERILSGDYTSTPFFIRMALKAPMFTLQFVSTRIASMPFFNEWLPQPHNYSSSMQSAVLWLNSDYIDPSK